MKQLLIYYMNSIITPFIIMLYLLEHEYKLWFVSVLFIYALIYRPIIDGLRLISKGVIPKSKFWYSFIPFWKIKWMKQLYLP